MKNLSVSLLIFAFLLASACSQKEEASPAPELEEVTPQMVPAGATVVIIGKYFSATPTDNKVTFSGIPATVTEATTTQLFTAVPAGVFDKGQRSTEIDVTVQGRPSTKKLTLTSDKFPKATSIEPSTAPVGAIVTISGQNFNLSLTGTKVLFSAPNNSRVEGSITSASPGQIQVKVPTGALSGDVWVLHFTTSDQSVSYSQLLPFTVAP